MKKILFTFLLLAAVRCGYSQACAYWPADCPDRDYANADLATDSVERLLNPLVTQEVTMEYRLRELTGEMVGRMAVQQHWETVVELSEWGSSGYRAADESVLAYKLRPPHTFSITWEVIVDKDSLAAWGNWLNEFAEKAKKLADQYANGGGAREVDFSSLQAERKSKSLSFRDATVLLVQFDFNMDYASEPFPGKGIGSQVRWYYNPAPDMADRLKTYTHSRNAALMLIGAWDRTPDGDGLYKHPAPAKSVKCDEVRDVAIYLSGNKAAIGKALKELPGPTLNGMIMGPAGVRH